MAAHCKSARVSARAADRIRPRSLPTLTPVLFRPALNPDGFILTIVALHVVCLYALLLTNLAMDNVTLAVVFVFLSLFSALCHYTNPRILLLEYNKKGVLSQPLAHLDTGRAEGVKAEVVAVPQHGRG